VHRASVVEKRDVEHALALDFTFGERPGPGGKVKEEMEVVESKLHLFGCPHKDLEKFSNSGYENFRKNLINWENCRYICKCLYMSPTTCHCLIYLISREFMGDTLQRHQQVWFWELTY
jgi:hypothetical protein